MDSDEVGAAATRFLAATDRDRWWTTPELTVPIVASGLWAAAGLGNPTQQHIVARNGPRSYAVEVDGEDWTEVVDSLLGTLAPDLSNTDPMQLQMLIRTAVGSDRESPFYIYKRFGALTRSEVHVVRELVQLRMKFEQQHADELATTEALMQLLGAETAGEVVSDPGLVELVVEVPAPEDESS